MIVSEALTFGYEALRESSTGRLDAEILLGWILVKDRAFLRAHGETVLSNHQEAEFHDCIRRRGRHEPIAYITGEKEWYGLSFLVNPDVLIPRPETELIVERSLILIDQFTVRRVADVGTGSGCIAIAIAREHTAIRCTGLDTSKKALKTAKLNINRHRLNTRIRLYAGTISDLPRLPELVVANLPYLNDTEMATLPPDVRLYEPEQALYGGPDGFDAYRDLCAALATLESKPIALLIEISPVQRTLALRTLAEYFPGSHSEVFQDLSGLDRVISVIF